MIYIYNSAVPTTAYCCLNATNAATYILKIRIALVLCIAYVVMVCLYWFSIDSDPNPKSGDGRKDVSRTCDKKCTYKYGLRIAMWYYSIHVW